MRFADYFGSRPGWIREELGDSTGRGIRVAVVDSGWRGSRREGRVRQGISFVDPEDDLACRTSDDTVDRSGHGTLCSELILSVAPGVDILPVRVFGRSLETSVPTVVRALEWAVEHDADVVNVSLGTVGDDGIESLYRACASARDAGLIVVAASRRREELSYPAAFDAVIAVAGMRTDDPYGLRYRPESHIEFLAKGSHRFTPKRGEAVTIRGNSFAAPILSGIVALCRERDERMNVDGARRRLVSLAHAGLYQRRCGRK